MYYILRRAQSDGNWGFRQNSRDLRKFTRVERGERAGAKKSQCLKKQAKNRVVEPVEKPEPLLKVKKKKAKKVVYVQESDSSSSEEEQVVLKKVKKVKKKVKKIKKSRVVQSSSESDTPLKKGESSYTESSYHALPPEPRYSSTQLRYSRMLGI